MDLCSRAACGKFFLFFVFYFLTWQNQKIETNWMQLNYRKSDIKPKKQQQQQQLLQGAGKILDFYKQLAL